MGTPEFPDLGKHCSVEDCKQIDFLPFTCDGCRRVFCLEHRSYANHRCPSTNRQNVTVAVCPLCAQGVRLVPEEDPNITWESHANTDCNPSNYEKVTRKRKCPVSGCRELLTFSNTVRCRDCNADHCLKHRFGADHKCPGPKKRERGFPFMGLLSGKDDTRKASRAAPASSPPSKWGKSLLSTALSVRASAETGMVRLGSELSQAMRGMGPGGGRGIGTSGSEACPRCGARFGSVEDLVDHVERIHERSKVTIDVCPKCSRGFRDPVSLVRHVERDHGGTSNG